MTIIWVWDRLCAKHLGLPRQGCTKDGLEILYLRSELERVLVRAEDWLWMTASENRKADKERDKPRMVGNTMGLGSKKQESRRKTPALKKNRV